MATSNFWSMDNFPLIVAKDEYSKVCPECGCLMGDTDNTCTECGADISNVEAIFDELASEDNYENMKYVADKITEDTIFFKVTVKGGYYSGLQFYVDYENDGYDPETATNKECRYDYDMCRSMAIRKHNAEIKRITRELRKAKTELGLTELGCMGVMSNGEAVYREVKATKKGTQAKSKKVA